MWEFVYCRSDFEIMHIDTDKLCILMSAEKFDEIIKSYMKNWNEKTQINCNQQIRSKDYQLSSSVIQ